MEPKLFWGARAVNWGFLRKWDTLALYRPEPKVSEGKRGGAEIKNNFVSAPPGPSTNSVVSGLDIMLILSFYTNLEAC